MRRGTQFGLLAALLAVVAVLVALAFRDPAPTPTSATDTPTPSATPTPTEPPRIVFLGDSFTAGSGAPANTPAEAAEAGYAGQTGRALGAAYQVLGQGGTGYLNPGQPAEGDAPYPDRAPSVGGFTPDLVVVQGGGNDIGHAGLSRAVRDTLAAVNDAAPDAQVVVVGPVVTPDDDVPALRAVAGVLQDEATAAGAEFIDALDWLPDARYYIADRAHPNGEGHTLIAQQLVPLLEPLL